MTSRSHLCGSRPHGHGWTDEVYQDAQRTGSVELLHQGDHRALGEHAGHTHTPATKEKP